MRRSVSGRWLAVLLLATSSTLVGCSSDPGPTSSPTTARPAGTTTTIAADPTDGPAGSPDGEWRVETPEAHGMDAAVLEKARDYAFAEDKHTQSVIVIREGAIVAEWYADGADQDSWAASWSMAKSFTSALIGIAIDEGKIDSVDEPMTTWIPEWKDTDRASIKLRDVLEMASGLDWDETYAPSGGVSDIIRMVTAEGDELAYATSRPAGTAPGTKFAYSSGDSMLLSGVLETATGMSVADYAQEKLFDPIGIDQVEWWQDAEDHTLTYCCLDTTSRDFARFGLLFLRDGRWGDDQIVPEAWVKESTAPSPTAAGYGYQWWLAGDDAPVQGYFASGHDGQRIQMVPNLDLIVVRNGEYRKDPGSPVADPNLFGKYPSGGLVPGKGTTPPSGWDETAFMAPILESIDAG